MVDLNLQQKMNKYEWKIRSLAKGIDANLALQELERIESTYGALLPEHILKESESENAVLHYLFEWNDDKAANHYRLQQARTIVNNVCIKVIKDGQSLLIPVYEIVTIDNERKYISIEAMSQSNIEQVKKSTIRDLHAIQKKLETYQDFDNTIQHLRDAASTLE